LSPPISAQYWIPLYGILVLTIIGRSIPTIIGWVKAKSDIRKSNLHHNKMKSLYEAGKRDDPDI
jgi:hypothetical protein